ncbi:hypothetical protein ISN44_As06g038180 [Arabidopsis suecica]|uniref:RNase H type-1 domain-containing protein n=1 Tax=Arabidopsis suecica TaxID=45249 RepID=A0A8T2CRX0_ARASU|nr:hypothetical protein ISN44_As06g038180 [Arabidopsis suecica]
MVKGLHPSQNPAGIKIMMPKIWKLEGRITSRINEDGSVQFFFKHEHQLLTVLDNGPWTYKDWLVVVDRWTRRTLPDFLRIIRFWVKILNIPDDSKEDRSIREIGGVLGHVEEVHIKQPTADLAGEVWVRVPIDISARLLFARYFDIADYREPVLIRFFYDKLRKFCSACGSLTHLAAACTFQIHEAEQLQLPAPSPNPAHDRTMKNMNQLENQSHTPTEVTDDTMRENVGSNINMDTCENQLHNGSQGEFMDLLIPGDMQARINETFAIQEIGSASAQPMDRGTKRKLDDEKAEDEVSTNKKRGQGRLSPKAKGEDINRRHKLDILFLVETKNKDAYVQNLGRELQFVHSFLVPPEGLSGGLAIFWKDTVKCDFLDTPTLNYTHMYVSEGPNTFCLTYVYGNPERRPRQQMWQRMINLSQAGLHEIRTYGGKYTWLGNRASGTIKSKLDRALATTDWKEQYPKEIVQLLDWCGSDHRPLLLQTDNKKGKGKRLFRYDNRWRHNAEVHQVIQNTWQKSCHHLSPQDFNEALKRCRNGLSQWKSDHNNNSQKKIQQLQMVLQRLYNSSYLDYNSISEVKLQLQHEYQMEEEYWRTKSRIQWLYLGDKNTRYFHERTKQRRSHNRITSLQDEEGNIRNSEEEIYKIIHSYFQQIYTSSGMQQLEGVLQHIQPKVTPEIKSKLLEPVTEDEIFQALTHMNADKAPGPDGFNAGFYKYHWDTIKSGLMVPNTNLWDEAKLQAYIHPEDIKIIKKIRPQVVKSPDMPTWIHTRDGQYTVKSGYHQLTKPPSADISDSLRVNNLCKSIWSLNIPPKVKHLWWKIIHNALPIAEALGRRRLRISPECLFCGEACESIYHLFFQCRVANEIWELSPVDKTSGQFLAQNTLLDKIQALLAGLKKQQTTDHLFPFIGWRIWKARNDLLFNNKRWSIPDVITQALVDLRLWTEANHKSSFPKQPPPLLTRPIPTTLQEVLSHIPSLCCCTDASWLNQDSKIGIGWTLHDSSGRFILKGSASMEATNSVLEAEAIALREALIQMKRLNYHNVTFCGDSLALFGYLEKAAKNQLKVMGPHKIQGYLQDILLLAHDSFTF